MFRGWGKKKNADEEKGENESISSMMAGRKKARSLFFCFCLALLSILGHHLRDDDAGTAGSGAGGDGAAGC